MSAPSKCTISPKHKWEWVKDITIKATSIRATRTTVKFSRRGVFKCACDASRNGAARSGL